MQKYDVIVVGSGFAGLFAASRLQRQGLSTLVIEKASFAGGLCGNFELDGYEFHRACFEYPDLLERELTSSGLDYPFYEPTALLYADNKKISFPPKIKDIVKLIPYCLDFYRLWRNLRKNNYQYLSELTEASVKNDFIKSILYVFSLGEGAPPEKVSLRSIEVLFDKTHNYGYQKPVVPKGGNQMMIDAIVEHLKTLGVDFLFNTEKKQVINQPSHKEVVTNQGSFQGRYVVTSENVPSSMFPKEYAASLANSILLLAIDKSFNFPDITEALYLPNVPKGNGKTSTFWMNDIYDGKMPEDHGFILSKTDIQADDHFTVNIYCLAPRGNDDPSEDEIKQISHSIYQRLEQMFPGIEAAIVYRKFLSVSEYEKQLHMRPEHTPFHMLANSIKPDNYDTENDIYYVGKSVYPQGENSGASMLSGITVAEQIISRDKKEHKPNAG